jgi:hypothetical protein
MLTSCLIYLPSSLAEIEMNRKNKKHLSHFFSTTTHACHVSFSLITIEFEGLQTVECI